MDTAVTIHIAAAPADFRSLRRDLRGTLVMPADPTFEDERGVWNLAHQGTPVAIARVADADDVATAIRFARRHEIEIAVRSGGHSLAGHSSGDDVLVIDVRGLRGLHIDPEERIAWAGAGLTAGEYTTAAAAHGLATPFGDTASVGLGGITLGGGIGWLARKHGLTIDSLIAVEIVTAAGEVLTASVTEHSDLFWAIRGGGGNFGVVTRFCYRLHPVDLVLGGAIVLPPTRDVLRSLVPIASSAPPELTIIAMLMATPPVPFVPEERHGSPSLMLMFVHAGDPEAGRAAIAPFRAVATPYGEAVDVMPYPAIYDFTEGAGTAHSSTTRSVFLDLLDDASVDAILGAFAVAPPGSMVQLRVFGGAMGRVPAPETAFAHRRSPVLVAIINGLADGSAATDSIAWNRSLFRALEPKATGVYANFLEDEGDARIRAAYPAGAYERLVEIKRRYDPANLFRRNQNIRPG